MIDDFGGRRPMPHGYTNDTRGDGAIVVKGYQGPDAAERRRREGAVLRRLGAELPVPPLLAGDDQTLTVGFLPGVHGQDLLESGAADVLGSCGRALRLIHAVDPAEVFPEHDAPAGSVLVHGDFGPNNLLFDPDTFAVTGILDWEWAHPGRPVEDLAWCEWIVRMHHQEQAGAVDALFEAYGDRPAWGDRRRFMLARCAELLELCRRWDPGGDGERLWRDRIARTAAWSP